MERLPVDVMLHHVCAFWGQQALAVLPGLSRRWYHLTAQLGVALCRSSRVAVSLARLPELSPEHRDYVNVLSGPAADARLAGPVWPRHTRSCRIQQVTREDLNGYAHGHASGHASGHLGACLQSAAWLTELTLELREPLCFSATLLPRALERLCLPDVPTTILDLHALPTTLRSLQWVPGQHTRWSELAPASAITELHCTQNVRSLDSVAEFDALVLRVFPHLTSLTLLSCWLPLWSGAALPQLPALQRLELSLSPWLPPDAAKSLPPLDAAQLPHLAELHLHQIPCSALAPTITRLSLSCIHLDLLELLYRVAAELPCLDTLTFTTPTWDPCQLGYWRRQTIPETIAYLTQIGLRLPRLVYSFPTTPGWPEATKRVSR